MGTITTTEVRSWTQAQEPGSRIRLNRWTLLLGSDGNYYVMSWVYRIIEGNETMIFPAREDGSVIEHSELAKAALPRECLAQFHTRTPADIQRLLDTWS